MRISFIGAGYAGLVNSVGFAKLGHNVICVDIDKRKVELINKGKTPLRETGLEEALQECLKKQTISATTSIEDAFNSTEITFIAVGTPSNKDGSVDLTYVEQVAAQLGKLLSKKKEYHLLVMKSTVPPGTTESLVDKLQKLSGKKAGKDFGVAMVPEFLKEGVALSDFLNPERTIIGSYDEKSGKILSDLHKQFNSPIIVTDLKTAEMIKYAANAFLATKVTFSNEIGNICKQIGIDVYDVMEGIGLDSRIGKKFLRAGIGFGGSCFPKDVKALIAYSKKYGYNSRMLDSVIKINDEQPLKLVSLLKNHTKLKGTSVAVLGIAFKPGTDDIREAASIKIINALVKEKAKVVVYDPEAMENAKKVFSGKISYADSAEDAVKNSKYVLLVTEWPQFQNPELYNDKIVIDGRKVLNKKTGAGYEGVCW